MVTPAIAVIGHTFWSLLSLGLVVVFAPAIFHGLHANLRPRRRSLRRKS